MQSEKSVRKTGIRAGMFMGLLYWKKVML